MILSVDLIPDLPGMRFFIFVDKMTAHCNGGVFLI